MALRSSTRERGLKGDDNPSFQLTGWLVVGLGNPGEDYKNTRHNVGFQIIDRLVSILDKDMVWFKRSNGSYLRYKNIIFLKPRTYMNNSGEAVLNFANFFKIRPENIIIIYDEVYLPSGRAKLSFSGSSAGHNGLASVIKLLGSADFYRVRVGVGLKPDFIPLRAYVLKRLDSEEETKIFLIFERVKRLILRIIELSDISREFNWFNQVDRG